MKGWVTIQKYPFGIVMSLTDHLLRDSAVTEGAVSYSVLVRGDVLVGWGCPNQMPQTR